MSYTWKQSIKCPAFNSDSKRIENNTYAHLNGKVLYMTDNQLKYEDDPDIEGLTELTIVGSVCFNVFNEGETLVFEEIPEEQYNNLQTSNPPTWP